jgi:hypothetical protein
MSSLKPFFRSIGGFSVLFVLLYVTRANADWIQIDGKDSISTEILTESIVRQGDVVSFVNQLLFEEPELYDSPPYGLWLGTRAKYAINCSKGSFKVISLYAIIKSRKGITLQPAQVPDNNWLRVTAHSRSQQMMDFVCQ